MYDFAIIGSGAAGGRLAYDLTAAGAACVLIEAGRAFEAATFPGHELDYSTQMFWGGGLEFSADARLGFLRGKCLGGSTVVNQALFDRFDDLVFEEWRQRSGVSFFTSATMAPDYDAAEKMAEVKTIPEKYHRRNAKIFIRALEERGLKWSQLRRAERDCAHEHGSDCLVCLGGCPRDSKQSALVTTIRQAKANGLKIETEFEIYSLADRRDKVIVQGFQRGEKVEITAAKAVLAAGALGSTGILLRSTTLKTSPRLGKGFCCHPQFMTYAVFPEPVDAHKGPFQAVKSDDPALRRAGYKFENVFAPPGATALLLPGFGKQHQDLMKKYRYLACMEVCVREDPVGEIRLSKQGRLVIHKPLTASDRRKIKEGLGLVQEMFQAAGAARVITCPQGFGLHLMGGCAIGVHPADSVVNPDFQLHDHPNIYVADSSIFPSAPGINPCLSVLALSHRAGRRILSGGRP